MMKIPDEFMATDGQGGGYQHGDYQHPQTVQQNHFRRGSLDSPKPVFKPARRREERRQRPQRHTTVVTAAIDQSVALVASIKKGESTGGLNRTLHPHLTSNNQTTNNNRLWNSSVKIETDPADHNLSGKGSGSLRPFFTKEGSEASTTPIASEAATTTGGSPPTPPVDFEASTTGAIISTDPLKINNNNSLNIGGLLPSTAAASVVRALSPLLTPAAFKAAANNMSQKVVLKAKEAVQGIEPQQQPHHVHGTIVEEQVVHKITPEELPMMSQSEFEEQYDIVQKIGEGWFSRVYLTEHRNTHHELVIKAINSKNMSVEEFLREFHHSMILGSHRNILTVFPDMVYQLEGQCCMFATEYAPLGDLTSNINDQGIGEVPTKRVARQIGSALDWVHSKNLCHLDVKLDNILVFKSDFTKVKLCDFGSVKSQGDIVIKKNELLPYCPPELVAKHANEYYQVDRVQDVFQFGIVIFFCLFGILPWQRADPVADPHFAEFCSWRRKRTSKIPKNFKPLSSRAHKLFKKLLDPDPERRLRLNELPKMTGDDMKWLRRHGGSKSLVSLTSGFPESISGIAGCRYPNVDTSQQLLCDGISQLTMGSFQSVHSNAVEKNKVLNTLLQHGVETTVDRSQKNSRIMYWIQNGRTTDPAEQLELQTKYDDNNSTNSANNTLGPVVVRGSVSSSEKGSEELVSGSQIQQLVEEDQGVDE